MNPTSYTRTESIYRWTQRLAAGLSCAAVVGCGGGGGSDSASAPAAAPAPVPASAAPEAQAASTQLLATPAAATVEASAAAASRPERYNRVVYQLYLAYFGRPPDPASLAQYAVQLNAAGTQPTLNALMSDYSKNPKVRALIDAFAASPESTLMYSGTTEQFIDQLYRTVMGRAPDADGKGFWVGVINSGKLTRTMAALALMSGSADGSDAAAIDKKLDAATEFTTRVQELQLGTVYAGSSDATSSGRFLLTSINAASEPAFVTSSIASTLTLLEPPQRASSLGSIAPDAITDVRVASLSGAAQTKMPFTFGQPFIAGEFKVTDGLIGRLSGGATIALQVDVKATHPDGSVRHAIISGVLPSIAARETKKIDLLKGTAPSTTATPVALPSELDSTVKVVIDGVTYSADLAKAMAAPAAVKWLTGPIASESIFNAPFKSTSGVAHPHLTARFAVRAYAGLANRTRLDVTVENNRTFTAGARNFRYDVKIMVGDRVAFEKASVPHYHHARWHEVLWTGTGEAPPVHVKHHAAYMIASKAVPNYDLSVIPNEAALQAMATSLTADKVGPMKIGPLQAYMPTSGGRPDIGPLPSWAVMYLLSMDMRAWNTMIAAADGAGSWSIHYRDDKTGYPIRLDNAENKTISTHMNLAYKGPLPVPRCAENNKSNCATPYTHDTAHQPSLVYLPYLLTGDYFYLEELQFWAAQNSLETDPNLRGTNLGLVRWQQLRGQAWSLRTLGQSAYITPDTHYMKEYFEKQVDNNLAFYKETYVTKNPNALGVYDGSGWGSFQVTQSAPWQDDFFTWSFGYLQELGFTKAEPILKWKAKYAVGRMTAPGYCFIEGAAYWLKYRESASTPIYSSFAELYAANFSDTNVINDESRAVSHPLGLTYMDLQCGGQAQADWRTAATKSTWQARQMTGYSTSNMGYPSNMQIALAVAAGSGIPNAQQAWSTFHSRTAKPDYSKGPQFAIVPR